MCSSNPVNRCTELKCRADYSILVYDKTKNYVNSVLGASAQAGVSEFGQAKADANAHIVRLEGEGLKGWANYDMSVGKVGAAGNALPKNFKNEISPRIYNNMVSIIF